MHVLEWLQLPLYQMRRSKLTNGFSNAFCVLQTLHPMYYLQMLTLRWLQPFMNLSQQQNTTIAYGIYEKTLKKNLKGKLCGEYSKFVAAWNKCQNCFSENEFKKQWNELTVQFPAACKYLKRTLGTDVTSWVLCYTHRSFNAGIQSTQRVESYNSLIKQSVKSSSTLLELDAHIQFLLDREEQFERQEQTSENPTVGLSNVIGRYFKRIDVIIKKFLTPRV